MANGKSIDRLVLGTVNAPWKSEIDSQTLADAIRTQQFEEWLPHLATFLTEVRCGLILEFATAHQIDATALAAAYASVKQLTGETNVEFEAAMGVIDGS